MKEMTEQQARYRLTALCAKAEHCSGEMAEKLRQWGFDETVQARVIRYLVDERYVDDERFCRYFVHDKLRYNGWGRRKIEQALYGKHVDREIYEPILDEISDEEYMEVLCPLIRQKAKSIKAKDDYEFAAKLIRFAMGRGFDYELIKRSIENIP